MDTLGALQETCKSESNSWELQSGETLKHGLNGLELELSSEFVLTYGGCRRALEEKNSTDGENRLSLLQLP